MTHSHSIADLVVVASLIDVAEFPSDLKEKFSVYCVKELPNFLKLWSIGCCSSTTIDAIIQTALWADNSGTEDICSTEGAVEAITNWRCGGEVLVCITFQGSV
jgi:hypothetical protein